MTSIDPGLRFEDLLQHADWVRRLAYRLVRDAAGAEDLVQDTWVVALEHPPGHARNLRGWLGRVVTNLAQSRGRAEGRRARREATGARAEALPPTDQLVAEAERSRELAGAVLELADPFRTVLLLRYFQGRSPTQIARELGRPVATVKTWLQRGLAKLRERLDGDYGDRRAWCVALLPLARGGAPAAGLTSSSLPTVAAAALLLATAWFGARALAPEGAPPDPLGGAAGPEARRDVAAVTSPPTPASAAAEEPTSPRVALAEDSDEPAAEAPTTPAEEGYLLRGRVVDLEGEPVSGLDLVWLDPGALRWADEARTVVTGENTWVPVSREKRGALLADPSALQRFARERFSRPDLAVALLRGDAPPVWRMRTGSLGEFEVRVPRFGLEVEAESEDWGLFGRSSLRGDDGREAWFATPMRTVVGRVLDARGEPCAELEVRLRNAYPERITPRLRVGRGLSTMVREARTGARGEFRFERVALADGFSLSAARGRGEEATVRGALADLPGPSGERSYELRLSPPAPTWHVTGTVYLDGGGPAPRATVVWGEVLGTTDERGVYALDLTSLEGDLFAARPGSGIAAASRPAEGWDPPPGDVRGPDLLLPRGSLGLAGRVVTRSGRAIEGARVRLTGAVELPDARYSLEDLAAGRTLGYVLTDDEGRFELPGLQARDYGLVASHGGRDQATRPRPAGTVGIEVVVGE